MDCPKCGNSNPVHVLFCMQCGHELSHKVEEVESAIQDEVVTEENALIERRLRELIMLGVFLLVAAWAVGQYGKSLPKFAFSVFTEAPRVQVEQAPVIPMPLPEDVAVPTAEAPSPPDGASEQWALRQLEEKIGK